MRRHRIRKQILALCRRIPSRNRDFFRLLGLTCKERLSPPVWDNHPVPPPKFRQLTTLNHISVDEHINEGKQAADMIIEATKRHGVRSGTILDFGCGCGRVLRHIHKINPQSNLCGTDVDGQMITWNRRHLSGLAQWSVNNYYPPSNLEANSFDLIIAISVFTHMDEEAQREWLIELKRILAPKGVAMITVLELNRQELNEHWDYRDETGMCYRYRRSEWLKRKWLRSVPRHEYYIGARHTEQHCRVVWGDILTFREFRPRALRHTQSLVVLRKND